MKQYLSKAKYEQAIADLLRSLYKNETLSYADWEAKAAKLLEKNVW